MVCCVTILLLLLALVTILLTGVLYLHASLRVENSDPQGRGKYLSISMVLTMFGFRKQQTARFFFSYSQDLPQGFLAFLSFKLVNE